MKKITYAFAALMICSSIAFTSCGKDDKAKAPASTSTERKAPANPVDEYVRLLDIATSKISKASTLDEVNAIEREFGSKIAELQNKFHDYVPNTEEQEKIKSAHEKLRKVGLKRIEELTESLEKETVETQTGTKSVQVVK